MEYISIHTKMNNIIIHHYTFVYLYTFLFSIYIYIYSDCRSTYESCPLVKLEADTELVGKISNDEDALYNKQTENVVNWCDNIYLYLNVSKTKEMPKMPQTSLH